MIGTLGGLGVALGTAWAGYGAMLYTLQDALLFPAPGVERSSLDAAARELGVRPLDLAAADGTRLYGWHRPAGPQPGAVSSRAVLYLHGNGESLAGSLALQRRVRQLGWDFAAVAYRGYPGSEGQPDEQGLLMDARALWDHLVGEVGIQPERIVVHGRSLGGGVAVGLVQGLAAEGQRPGALVLESTFTSVVALARTRAPLYPVCWLLKNPFDTAARLPDVRVPVLVLHGDADRVIPVEHGRRLAAELGEARYVEAPGRGHNELLVVSHPPSREAWQALLEGVGE